MKVIKLKIREPDAAWHELLVEINGDIVDIRPVDSPRCDADTSCPIVVGNEHCPVCLKQPEEDCETNGQTLVVSVELADA